MNVRKFDEEGGEMRSEGSRQSQEKILGAEAVRLVDVHKIPCWALYVDMQSLLSPVTDIEQEDEFINLPVTKMSWHCEWSENQFSGALRSAENQITIEEWEGGGHTYTHPLSHFDLLWQMWKVPYCDKAFFSNPLCWGSLSKVSLRFCDGAIIQLI